LGLAVETTEPVNSHPIFPVHQIEPVTHLSLKVFQPSNATALGFPADRFKDIRKLEI
jgi:hypothetical protein